MFDRFVRWILRPLPRLVMGTLLSIMWVVNIWLTGPELDMILVLIIMILGTIYAGLEWRGHPGIPPREQREISPWLLAFIGGALGLAALFAVLGG
ncbi:hypothetical protein [Roseobacter sinensis]|uniref:Uncharacterized protein n=1 Tax=Roseobacter sinensis TaxID=2931391 RepID=A0ABT3BJC1_9RHOB|nr:hypothetical protein [Roseobacter sp. WL0113]MCV3273667.1 hypothetical protein [Roseobacter sp. WL0113]